MAEPERDGVCEALPLDVTDGETEARVETEVLSELVELTVALSDGQVAVGLALCDAKYEGQLALAVTVSEPDGVAEIVLLPDADEVALGDADALHHEHVAERLGASVELRHAEAELDCDASGVRDSVTLKLTEGCADAVPLPLLLPEALTHAVAAPDALALPVALARAFAVPDMLALPEALDCAVAAPDTLALPETLAGDGSQLVLGLPEGGADCNGGGERLVEPLDVAISLALSDAWPPAPRQAASSSAAVSSAPRGRGPRAMAYIMKAKLLFFKTSHNNRTPSFSAAPRQ